jgi:hypothetical protein
MKDPGKVPFNPRLQWAILEVVDNQLKANDPPETRETLDRLMAEGQTREDARKLIGQVVTHELFLLMKRKEMFNHERFVRNLRRLPAPPEE